MKNMDNPKIMDNRVQSDDKVEKNINKLCQDVGEAGALRVLSFALPKLIEYEQDLKTHLARQDVEAAADCAHKILGSVRAYGTARLERLLGQVSARQVALAEVEDDLLAELVRVIGEVKAWLKQQGAAV